MGTNLAGMEWATGLLRSNASIVHNVHFAVPRAAEIAHLAANGFGVNRLPIQWELLQPMLSDTPANAEARAMIGQPGAFHEVYASYITGVLDAHAAVGARCMIDCHNYARYLDFVFQPDGSVIGLRPSADPLVRAYTTDRKQVRQRIFATAPGASLTTTAFADFWARVAQRWKDHPGFGGYCLMNEPYWLPRRGETQSAERGEDLMILPVFSNAAIAAIRAIDPTGVVYAPGNAWSGAMNVRSNINPGHPLKGDHIVYEVHAYLDGWNNGQGYDWDHEVATKKAFTVGVGPGPIDYNTGAERMRIATDWAREHGTRVALTETGMPIDDPRWQESFRRLLEHTWANGCEIYSWRGGNHWHTRNYPINHAPGWHQNRTLEAQVAGPMKQVAGIDLATLFDDGPGSGAPDAPVTITVYARGNLAAPVTLDVSSDSGGTFSKTRLVIPAGANGEDSYSFTPAPNRVTRLSYQIVGPARQLPPPRKVYSLEDPVGVASSRLEDAAMAILARYRACKWNMADGYTDYIEGHPAAEGERIRAVADSGFGSSVGNAMEMLIWTNDDGPGMGPMVPPVMRRGGAARSDHSAPGTVGFWCRKTIPEERFPKPRNRVPYNLHQPHFVLAAVTLPDSTAGGTVFEATAVGSPWHVALVMNGSRPRASWSDKREQNESTAQSVVLDGPAVAANARAVIALSGAPGAQQLRVNSVVVDSAAATMEPRLFGQMLMGWGDPLRGVAPAFRGHLHAVITGRGNPTADEFAVLETYLASL